MIANPALNGAACRAPSQSAARRLGNGVATGTEILADPKWVNVKTHRILPPFISTRGAVALRPGDGVIHSWLNRLLLPDTVEV